MPSVSPRLCGLLLAVVFVLTPSFAVAGERYALVVSGASGGEQYAQQYDTWRTTFVDTLLHTLGYRADHVTVLAEQESGDVHRSTRENVRDAIADLRRQSTADDVVLVLLIGHGAGEGDDAKFNLVGPDLSAGEWAELLRPVAGRLVFVDTASGSFPFLQKLAARNRIVITANDSAAQQFETIFPRFFIKAFEDPEADADKNGKVSVWEAFVYASDGVRRAFQDKGTLATERALIDDNADGIGREADQPGADGQLAQITYIETDRPIVETGDAELTSLLRRRAAIEAELDAVRVRKPEMSPEDYENALEKLLLELAQIDRRVRSKS